MDTGHLFYFFLGCSCTIHRLKRGFSNWRGSFISASSAKWGLEQECVPLSPPGINCPREQLLSTIPLTHRKPAWLKKEQPTFEHFQRPPEPLLPHLHFPPAFKRHRQPNMVPLFQEPPRLRHLHAPVVVGGVGTQAHLFGVGQPPALPCSALLLLFPLSCSVEDLVKVRKAADWGRCRRVDGNKV